MLLLSSETAGVACSGCICVGRLTKSIADIVIHNQTDESFIILLCSLMRAVRKHFSLFYKLKIIFTAEAAFPFTFFVSAEVFLTS